MTRIYFLNLNFPISLTHPTGLSFTGNYYCINMTLVTLSTFLCLIVVNLHFRGDRRTEVPHWLRKVMNISFAQKLPVPRICTKNGTRNKQLTK